MTAGVAAPALRQRSVPQMFDAIIALGRREARVLFVLGILFHLPVHVFRIAAAFAGPGSFVAGLDPEMHVTTVWWSLWNTLAVASAAIAACQVYTDGETGVRRVLEAMRAGGWRLFGVIAAYAIVVDGLYTLSSSDGPQMVLAFLLVFALPWMVPTIPAGTVERIRAPAAVRRAIWLVRGNYWRVAVVVWVVWSVTYVADSGLVNFSYGLLPRAPVPRIADVLVDGVLYPLRGLVMAVVYFDCRIRREAYDIERLMEKG